MPPDESHEGTFTTRDLIDWAQGLPPWQQDALRRILQHGSVRDSDIDELVELARAAVADNDDAPAPVPATAANVGAPPSAPTPVCIQRISDIAHVNALSDGPVEFEGNGLTVLYGENGSGKSGITRILREACTTRARTGVVHPNVFNDRPTQPPSASISFTVGGETRTFTWALGATRDPDLSSVHVFDREYADTWVSSDNEPTYTPWILRIFRLLAEATHAVATRLRRERSDLETPAFVLGQLGLHDGTSVNDFVATLSAATTEQEIENACRTSDEERARLAELEAALHDDPLARVSDRRVVRRRVVSFQERAADILRDLGDEALSRIDAALELARSADETARVVRTRLQEVSRLPGVGQRPWTDLWEAATRYSEEVAYPSRAYPVLSADAVCVLCQQPYREDSVHRMQAIADMMHGESQRQVDTAMRELRAVTGAISLHDFASPSRVVVAELGVTDANLAREIREFLVAARCRKRQLLMIASGDTVADQHDLPTPPDLTPHLANLKIQIEDLDGAAQDEGRRELVRERDELKDRITIAALRPSVLREVIRLKAIAQLDAALLTANTAPITRKQGEVERLVVTERLRANFQARLLEMGFDEVPVEIAMGEGRRGTHPVGLRLDARQAVEPHAVLSEGERTAVALAGLLAELDTQGNASAVVLDDPVSSLDHNYREDVAIALVRESTRRQIIVLTHDVLLLVLLKRYARDNGLSPKILAVRRGGPQGQHGQVDGQSPWETMSTNDRIAVLRGLLTEARRDHGLPDRSAYVRKARFIYTRLRETWERAVEEVLLAGVVTRFDPAVHTQMLRTIAGDVLPQDAQLIATEMSRCSGYTHDRPAVASARMPAPDVVEQRVSTLAAWVAEVRRRRRR